MKILKLFWTRDIFNLLADNFQIRDTGVTSYPTYQTWASFLAVVFKNSIHSGRLFLKFILWKRSMVILPVSWAKKYSCS